MKEQKKCLVSVMRVSRKYHTFIYADKFRFISKISQVLIQIRKMKNNLQKVHYRHIMPFSPILYVLKSIIDLQSSLIARTKSQQACSAGRRMRDERGLLSMCCCRISITAHTRKHLQVPLQVFAKRRREDGGAFTVSQSPVFYSRAPPSQHINLWTTPPLRFPAWIEITAFKLILPMSNYSNLLYRDLSHLQQLQMSAILLSKIIYSFECGPGMFVTEIKDLKQILTDLPTNMSSCVHGKNSQCSVI